MLNPYHANLPHMRVKYHFPEASIPVIKVEQGQQNDFEPMAGPRYYNSDDLLILSDLSEFPDVLGDGLGIQKSGL